MNLALGALSGASLMYLASQSWLFALFLGSCLGIGGVAAALVVFRLAPVNLASNASNFHGLSLKERIHCSTNLSVGLVFAIVLMLLLDGFDDRLTNLVMAFLISGILANHIYDWFATASDDQTRNSETAL